MKVAAQCPQMRRAAYCPGWAAKMGEPARQSACSSSSPRCGLSLYSSIIATPATETDMTLDELFQNQHSLPSAPKVVEDLIGSFEDPNVSVDDVAKKLANDPVLSAKLL